MISKRLKAAPVAIASVVGLLVLAAALGAGLSEAQQGTLYHCPSSGKWAVSVWRGDAGTDPGQALDNCGERAVVAAYSLDPETQVWSRWFLDKAELSNLSPLQDKQGILTLGGHKVEALSSSGQLVAAQDGGQLWNCPLPDKWSIAVWEGPSTLIEEAATTCAPETLAAAYYLEPETQIWSRWFVNKPEVSNLTALDDLQGLMTLGAVAASTPTPVATETPSATPAATVAELEWHNPIGADGQIVLPNHDRLLAAPVVSDDGERILYSADFGGYSEEPLFPPEASPGEGFFADIGTEKLTAFPPGDCPLRGSEDLQAVIFARFSQSGQAIYSLNRGNGNVLELVKDSAVGCDYDVSGDKLVYLTGTRSWEVRDGGIWFDVLGWEDLGPDPTFNEIYVLDLTTGERVKAPPGPIGFYFGPQVSSDGTRAAFLVYEMSGGLEDWGMAAYFADLVSGTVEKISGSDQVDTISISPDGTRIAYFAETDQEWIKSIRVYDTTIGDFVFTSEDSHFKELQIFPAGDKIAVTEEEPTPGDPEPENRLLLIDLASEERVTIARDTGEEFTISPDGSYIGYTVKNGQFDKRVPTGVTDAGLEYGATLPDVAYRGFIWKVE